MAELETKYHDPVHKLFLPSKVNEESRQHSLNAVRYLKMREGCHASLVPRVPRKARRHVATASDPNLDLLP